MAGVWREKGFWPGGKCEGRGGGGEEGGWERPARRPLFSCFKHFRVFFLNGKRPRRMQFICFLLLFKEPYKGKDLSAGWVLLTVFEKSPNGLFYSLEERKETSDCLCDCYMPFDHKRLSYRLCLINESEIQQLLRDSALHIVALYIWIIYVFIYYYYYIILTGNIWLYIVLCHRFPN